MRQPPFQDYLAPELRNKPGDPVAPLPGCNPRPGYGTVYVVVDTRTDAWSASWQDEGPTLEIADYEGARDAVLAWARAQPAAAKLIFDPTLDEMVPLV